MNFSVEREVLLEHLTNTNGIIDKSMSDASKCIVLDAEKALVLSATDTQHAYVARIPANVTTPGKIAVAADKLYAAVRTLSEPGVTFRMEGKRLALSGGASTFRMAVEASGLPELPSLVAEGGAIVGEADLLRLVEQVSPFVDPKSVQYGMNGAHLVDLGGGRLRMESTTGYHLARSDIGFSGSFTMPPESLLSRKALDVLKRTCDGDGAVRLAVADNAILVEKGATRLWFRTIKGEFPDCDSIIPTSLPLTFQIPKHYLSAALGRIAVVNQQHTATRFQFSEDRLRILGWNVHGEEIEDEIPVEGNGGVTLGTSARYFGEVVRAYRADTVTFCVATPVSPFILRDTDALFLLSPMVLQENRR